MVTSKYLSIKNTDDIFWLVLKNNKDNFVKIFNLFDFESHFEQTLKPNNNNWKKLSKGYHSIDDDSCLAYFIFGENEIHIILRRKRRHKEIKNNLMELFGET